MSVVHAVLLLPPHFLILSLEILTVEMFTCNRSNSLNIPLSNDCPQTNRVVIYYYYITHNILHC